MSRKKTIELVQETQLPKAFIVNGTFVSSFLAKTLEERGCEVEKQESYSPIPGEFKYIFLFDNQSLADEIYEKNLSPDGKFLLIETLEEEIPRPPTGQVLSGNLAGGLGTGMGIIPHPRYKILKVGDLSSWSVSELTEKILRVMFSSSQTIVDSHRKQKILMEKKKILQELHNVIPSTKKSAGFFSVNESRIYPKNSLQNFQGSLANASSNKSRDSSTRPSDLVGITTLRKDSTIKRLPDNKVHAPPILEKKQRFNFKKIFFAFVCILLGILLIFIGVSFVYISRVQKTFQNLEYHLQKSNLRETAADFKEARREIKKTQDVYNFILNILFPLRNISYVADLGSILETSDKVTAAGADFASIASEILSIKSGFSEPNYNLTGENLATFDKKLANFAATLIEAQGKFNKINFPYFPKERIQTVLSPTVSKLTSFYEFLPVFEKVFFEGSPKVYLVLFQNNMELRPTGGFIGSFGLLTISGGKVLDFKIEDVYTADGQLKGHVDPPLPIRKYLSQPHFFLRDSNFDPDFASSSAQAAFFLQKELGKNVDGVIGVNLTLAQKLLHVAGAIKLSDFGGEEITADNFFYKVHFLTQTNFFPGSTQKKDVLTAVVNEIFSKLNDINKTNFFDLIPVVKQALEEKNIQIFLENESMQKIIEEHGWAGRMVKVVCVKRKDENGQEVIANPDSCLADYLSIIEANLGVNKANYFINKSTVIEKKIGSDGMINNTITLSYENTNDTLVLTPQTYTNYLRIFVPTGSKLVNVTLNNAPLNTSDIDTESYGADKTSFGFLIKIAPNNRGVVKITYSLSRLLSGPISDYQLFYQKQAGDKNSPLVISFLYPDQFKLKPVNFSSTASRDSEIYYTTDTSVDRVFALKKE